MNENKRFWFVWNENGLNPRHKHESYESAQKEALRLSRANPTQKFIILVSLEDYQCLTVKRSVHKEEKSIIQNMNIDEIPF